MYRVAGPCLRLLFPQLLRESPMCDTNLAVTNKFCFTLPPRKHYGHLFSSIVSEETTKSKDTRESNKYLLRA